MQPPEIFAKRVFQIAGIYGIIIMVPQYFMETKIGTDYPPPITHPEFYYGFVGVTLAWQVLFLFMSQDPLRYRKLIIPSILEKFIFVPAVFVLYAQSRVNVMFIPAALIDLVLGVLFIVAYLKLKRPEA